MEDGAATEDDSTSADEETNRPSREKEGRPSLNSLALVRKAITPDDIVSMDIGDWHRAVYEGVFLKYDTQKFWVDAKLHKTCFLVLPEACDIAGSDEESCWNWTTMKEKWFSFRRDANIRVPESKKLSWLLIQGRFKTRALSPHTMYEVAFVVKLNKTDSEQPSLAELNKTDSERPSPAEPNQTNSERTSPVELELNLPDGTKQTYTKKLGQRQEEWINLRAGRFKMGSKTVGTISFALEGKFHPPKMSLILKGVLIHPKD